MDAVTALTAGLVSALLAVVGIFTLRLSYSRRSGRSAAERALRRVESTPVRLNKKPDNHDLPVNASLRVEGTAQSGGDRHEANGPRDGSIPVVRLLIRPTSDIDRYAKTLTKLEPTGYVLLDESMAVLAELAGPERCVWPGTTVSIERYVNGTRH